VHDVGPEYYEPQAQYGIAGRSLVNAGFVEFDPVDGEPSYGVFSVDMVDLPDSTPMPI
jgi:hypothetical protein